MKKEEGVSLPKKSSIKNWDEADRPIEKMIQSGRRAMSEVELLAILISSGTKEENALDVAQRIWEVASSNLNDLSKLTIHELAQYKGIGMAKAAKIVAALELSRRKPNAKTPRIRQFQVGSSRDAYVIMMKHLLDLRHEEFWMIMLNGAHKVIGTQQLSVGVSNATLVDPKKVYKLALDYHAAALIFAHNHPSGMMKPSEPDIDLTKKLVLAGKLFDINVLDHIIVGDRDYVSMADEGIMERISD
ncbi:MAG: DNA repair protein RadC [Pedobacter sp.]|nr:MAG: DNA repair protein RadC [Pedobacter sp.]